MSYEGNVLWDAMKAAKYRNTLAELIKVSKTEASDLTQFMNSLLRVVAEAVHAEVGTLWYYSKFADGRIHPKAAFGGSNLGDFSLAPGEGIAGNVILTGQGTIIQDCQKDIRWSGKVDAGTGFITRSMICVPLKDGDIGFGCIQLINRTDGSLYDDKDLKFMESLAIETSKIIMDHSKDLFMGYFSAFEDKNTVGFASLENCDSIEEMLLEIRKMPQYLQLSGFKVWAYEQHCRKLWKFCHPQKKED